MFVKYQVPKSMVWKWSKQEKDLNQEVAELRAKKKKIGTKSDLIYAHARLFIQKYPLARQKNFVIDAHTAVWA